MGSNMQRQAVPLLETEVPLVGTGLEGKVAEDSGALILAKRAGTVESATADSIVVRPTAREIAHGEIDYLKGEIVDSYKLTKFKRSNQDTCSTSASRPSGRGEAGRTWPTAPPPGTASSRSG
jgi:DNA-directed RNA polymerase subunit beta